SLHPTHMKNIRVASASMIQRQTTAGAIYFHHYGAPTLRVLLQNGFQRLHDRNRVSIGGEIIVSQCPHLLQTFGTLGSGPSELDEGYFLEEAAQHVDAIASLGVLAPRLQEGAVVVVIRRDLELLGRAAFHGDLDAAFALVRVPDAVVEAELHLLLDVAREIIR